jgi:hypothetical protein
VSLAFFIIALGLGIYIVIAKRIADKEHARLKEQLNQRMAACARLEVENHALSQFKAILDAKAEAARIIADTTAKAEEAQRAADLVRQQADSAARDVLVKAEETAGGIRAEADQVRRQAELTTKETLARAEEEAKGLRTQASQAMRDAQNRVESIMRSA